MNPAPSEPSLSLCLIVRNETPFLRSCVDSVRDVVDEVVIVDTGSTDGTQELASELADRMDSIDFDGDFSSARNKALELTRTEWVLFLDADERLEPSQCALLRQWLRNCPADVLAASPMAYNLFATGEFYTGRRIRLIRRRPGVRFERRINESVRASVLRTGGRVVDAPFFINHFGHCRSAATRKAKAERYLGLMHLQLQDQPDDAVLEGYVALNLRVLGRFEEALTWSERSMRSGGDNATVLGFRGHVLRSTGDSDGALAAYSKAYELQPSATMANMIGVMRLEQSDFASARAAFARSLELEPLMLPAAINTGLSYQAGCDWARAAHEFAEVAARNPAFLVDEWAGRTEVDCFRALYNETVFRFSGLAYHLAYCERQAANPLPTTQAYDRGVGARRDTENVRDKTPSF